MARRHRLRKAHIDELSDQIRTLEQTHKRTLAADTLDALLVARKALLGELHTRLKRKFALAHKLFYVFGNKKPLASALQKKRSAHVIHSITSPAGATITRTDLIAKQFTPYLSSLYNLPEPPTSKASLARLQLIEDFLATYGSPPVPTPNMSSLEMPITPEEA